MHKFFKESVKEALKYYVYALVDPRDKRIFYVGKGTGDRVFQHAEDSLNENDESLKLSTIREIHKAEKRSNIIFFVITYPIKRRIWLNRRLSIS